MKFLAVLFLAACFGQRAVLEPAPFGTPNAKIVHALISFASDLSWQYSPYWRVNDFGWPWNVAIADDGTACLLPNGPVDLPMIHSNYRCETHWRLPR